MPREFQLDVEITGTRTARRRLRRLQRLATPKQLESALMDAARVVQAEVARSLSSRRARKAVVVRKAARSAHEVRVQVGVVGFGGDLTRWHERGTRERIRKSGGSTGRVPARPTMGPAAERARGPAIARYAASLRAMVLRVAGG